ncbi:hypothetical protein [Segetibacter aerophilus]|uniref:Uncharacterized protein n=1 Tax=Segetibacter aerophilus TaxID=670293 RepID=A0A512B8N5_9BACT|nr:hypothetical protein [Segetibacter aerophilus]GEO08325.1 hypothetical protein SAE01_08210 [Segetibacter aerophilus]
MKRTEGEISEDGLTVTFKNLCKELAEFNDKPIELRGKGPLIRVCIAKATCDSEDEKIKKGDLKVQCFS